MKLNVKLLLSTVVLVGAVGCSSWIESSRKLIDDEEAKQAKERKKVLSKWVKRSEYDKLNAKYRNLSRKYDQLAASKAANSNSFDQIDELAKSVPSKSSMDGVAPSTPKPSASVTETVDVFGKGGLANEVEKLSISTGPRTISKDLKNYKKALTLKESGRVDEALRVFQYLEKTNFEQIQVRARMQIGAIYLEKNQYDLSLQVFETVIATNAFSGKILEALKGAVISCDGLGLTDKKLRYQSMLKDFFGIRS